MFVWLARFLAVRIGARLLHWGWMRLQNRPAPTRRGAVSARLGAEDVLILLPGVRPASSR